MGLFNRRQPKETDKERFLGAKLHETRYESLQELVIGEVSLNSADSKVVSISFPDERVVKIWVADNKVIAAIDTSNPVDLREFLYWIDASDGAKSILITEVKELTPEAIPSISSLAPALYDDFLSYANDYTFETLKWADANLASYTSVDTQIFKLKRVTSALKDGVSITEIATTLQARRKEEDKLAQLIGLAGIPYDAAMLSYMVQSYLGETPEERFILAAADAGSSLQDAFDLADGFSVLNLLKAVHELDEKHVISISFTTDELSQLPDLTDAPIKPYERIFVPTDMGDDMSTLAEAVFEQSAWREAAMDLVSDNSKLEERINVIEEKLIKELAQESFAEFQDLPGDVQASVRLLLNEREAHNNKRTAILEKIRENILVHDYRPDAELTELIDLKLRYIAAAVIRFTLDELSVADNDFEIDEPELEFQFKDGVIETDPNGEPFIREVADDEELDVLENADPGQFFAQAAEEDEDEDVDLDRHAFDFEDYELLSRVEKAALGVRTIPAKRDTLPPIFVQVATSLGIDPFTLGR